jgi:hypothetical protein
MKAQRRSKGRVSSTLYLTSALDGGALLRQAPSTLPPGKRPGTNCIGGWVGPRADLEGAEEQIVRAWP